MLPVQISYVLNPYDKLGEISFALRRKQILELFPEYKKKLDDIIESVNLLMKKENTYSNPYPIMSNNYSDTEVIGRDVEITEIHELLKDYNIINLYGMGGIGKTSLAIKYFNHYSSKGAYQSIHIAKFTTSIKKTISNIPFVGFDESAFLLSIKDVNLSKEDALFEKKMALLNNHANEILLVIDGIDYVNQEDIDTLTNLSIQVILTSRNKYNNVKTYEVKPLSIDELKKMFTSIIKKQLTESEEKALEKIIEEVGYHTLTLKLIASYAYDIGLNLLELENEGVLMNLNEFDNDEEKISTLLDKVNFSQQEIYALQILSLFPHGISKGKFQKIDRQTLRVYPNLVKKGWVITDDVSYQLHQIVRELVIKKYPIRSENISSFLSKFLELFRIIGFENNETIVIMKHMVSVIEGEDYLIARMYHLFGNAFCDFGYSQFFHISPATYTNQDMNFYNKKNETKSNFDEFLYSLKLNKKALKIAETLTDLNERKIIPYIYSYLGSTNFNMNEYDKALDYQLKALESAKNLLEKTDFEYLVILNRIGLTAMEVGNYSVALESFKEYEKIGLDNNLDLNYSMIKFNLGNVCYYTKKYDEAISYYLESIKLNKDDLETSFGYSELCLSLAFIYKEKNLHDEAKKYYEKAKLIKSRIIIDDDIINNFIKTHDKIFLKNY